MAYQQNDRGELVDKLVAVRRVAKTVKGGRRMSFSAIVVVGDEGGRVGWGKGKAREVPDAVRKATDEAKRAMKRVPMRQGRTLHHEVKGRFGAANVILKPAVPGTGIIAGGPMRSVFEAMGIKDVVSKSLGSNNPYNLIQATFEAFNNLETPRTIAAKRGLKVSDLSLHRQEAARGEVEQIKEQPKKKPVKKSAPKKANTKKADAKKAAPKKEVAPKVKSETKAESVKAAAKADVKAEVKADVKTAPKEEKVSTPKAETPKADKPAKEESK